MYHSKRMGAYVGVKTYLPESFVHTAVTADFIITLLTDSRKDFLVLSETISFSWNERQPKPNHPNKQLCSRHEATPTDPNTPTYLLHFHCLFPETEFMFWYQNIHKCISCILFIFLQTRTKFMRQYNVVAYVCWFQFFLDFPCVSSRWKHFAKVNLMVVCGIFTTWVS